MNKMACHSESDLAKMPRVSDFHENERKFAGCKLREEPDDYTCDSDGEIGQIDTETISPAEENEIMVRQRNNKKRTGRESDASDETNGNGQLQPNSAMSSRRSSRARSRGKAAPLGIKLIAGLGVVVACFVVMWLYYQQMLANRVNTPLDVPRVIASDEGSVQQDPERFWGTYRPGVYFGNKP